MNAKRADMRPVEIKDLAVAVAPRVVADPSPAVEALQAATRGPEVEAVPKAAVDHRAALRVAAQRVVKILPSTVAAVRKVVADQVQAVLALGRADLDRAADKDPAAGKAQADLAEAVEVADSMVVRSSSILLQIRIEIICWARRTGAAGTSITVPIAISGTETGTAARSRSIERRSI